MELAHNFFDRDVLKAAPDLVGKILIRKFDDNTELKLRITETEAYKGEEDLACHASKGRTPRTETLYMQHGTIYMYLIYGMYWMLNIVTEKESIPQAILIRGVEGYDGPGKLTRRMEIDKSFNRTSIFTNEYLRIEDDGYIPELITKPRVGIDYAGEIWAKKPWRYIDSKSLKEKKKS